MQNEQTAPLEVQAPTVEEAVQQGLRQLNLSRDEVKVEILEEGSRGFLGLGARPARIRLSLKTAEQAAPEAAPVMEETASPEETPAPPPAEEEPPVPQAAAEPAEESDEDARALQIVVETVQDLLEKMHVEAEVSAHYKPPEGRHRRPTAWVDIHGQDLSILIGRRAETLQALQYITSLIVNKELGRSLPLVIDVEGYRERRTVQLQRLAQRLAEQVVKTGRRQALEPMPASERRIIHLALRDHPDVTTESVGEEPRRKVTIIPKDE